ncbi:MAG: AEC family transporter [Burkholderiales bacterium]
MNYFARLFDLMVQVMLPLSLLVAAGGVWPVVFKDVHVEAVRNELNRIVLYLFYPCIMFAVAAVTPITWNLLTVPLLNGITVLLSGLVLYWLLYRSALGRDLADRTRAILMLGGMFGNTFNVGVPVLVFLYGADAPRYAVFNDMLMSVPFIWSIGVWICTRLGAHRSAAGQPSVWRIMASMPPIWAFVLGVAYQQSGLHYPPIIAATSFIGQATIPAILFALGMTIPWRQLTPRREILVTSAVKLVVTPVLTWAVAHALFAPLEEAQYAAVVEAATPAFVTLLVLASRFDLDSASAALLIGWSTILFWITLPLLMAAGIIQ